MADYNVVLAKSKTSKDRFLNDAPSFYKTFPHDHNINVKLPVKTLNSNSLLELLKELERCGNSNVLIVSHANTNGLYLSMNSNKAQWVVITCILLYANIEKRYRSLKNETDPEKWGAIINEVTKTLNMYSASQALQTLSDKSTSKGKKDFDKIIRDYKSIKDQAHKQKEAARIVKMVNNQVNKTLKDLLKISSLSRKNMDAYVKQIRKMYSLKRNIEIRGCNIGNNPTVLKILCLLFNAQYINAPRVTVMFGKSSIHIRKSQKTLNALMKKGVKKFISNKPAYSGCTKKSCSWLGGQTTNIIKNINRQALYYHPQNIASNKDELLFIRRNSIGLIIAEDISIVENFATKKFGKLAPGKQFTANMKTLPIQLTDTKPFLFRQDTGFNNYLVRVSNPGNFSL